MDLGRPATVQIVPINHGTEFRFRLRSNEPRVVAEFVVSAGDLTKLTRTLQALQARHGRRPSGKPSLCVVTDE